MGTKWAQPYVILSQNKAFLVIYGHNYKNKNSWVTHEFLSLILLFISYT
nr:MAG TPA: hypothetical protein [Caudoviricetes sp.]